MTIALAATDVRPGDVIYAERNRPSLVLAVEVSERRVWIDTTNGDAYVPLTANVAAQERTTT